MSFSAEVFHITSDVEHVEYIGTMEPNGTASLVTTTAPYILVSFCYLRVIYLKDDAKPNDAMCTQHGAKSSGVVLWA